MIITRFAPSPTGPLHLGHAAAALFARTRGDRFLLRIEDIDPARCRPEYRTMIEQDLAWLGLTHEGPVRVQSEHLPDYAKALARLREAALLYPCFCTRSAIAAEHAASAHAPHDPGGVPLYPGTCRHLTAATREARIAAGAPHAWRLDIAKAAHQAGPLTWHEAGQGPLPSHPETFGDIILARRDTPASYHLCVTHDDALQGVTLVTRSEDLRPATAIHRLLQSLLGWPEPHYAHHPILHDAEGRRLAKRHAAATIRDLRAQGLTPAAVLQRAEFPP